MFETDTRAHTRTHVHTPSNTKAKTLRGAHNGSVIFQAVIFAKQQLPQLPHGAAEPELHIYYSLKRNGCNDVCSQPAVHCHLYFSSLIVCAAPAVSLNSLTQTNKKSLCFSFRWCFSNTLPL